MPYDLQGGLYKSRNKYNLTYTILLVLLRTISNLPHTVHKTDLYTMFIFYKSPDILFVIHTKTVLSGLTINCYFKTNSGIP